MADQASAPSTAAQTPRPLVARRGKALRGAARVPGDKSISHRALMFGALALGEARITNLLEGEDVLHTAAALRALGATIIKDRDGTWRTRGRGVGGLQEPAQVLDMGNSGTAARLLMGVLASHGFTSTLTGDASLVRRPMARVTNPLGLMGARFSLRSGGRLPGAIIGTEQPVAITYRLPVASAQVKSAILLAGLNAPGRTTVLETHPTRDHTERMLRHFGADVTVQEVGAGEMAATVAGQGELRARDVAVPGDPSSAAFPAVAALLIPGSDILLPGVGVNPSRVGLYQTLQEMGADLTLTFPREEAGEPVADLVVRHSPLTGVRVPPERAPSMIDEYPVLAVAAAFAQGTTLMEGIGELRVKESDRLAMVANGLAACGVDVEAGEDWLAVHGTGTPPPGGARVETAMDHRIAMSFLIMGLGAQEPVAVDDGSFIDTSFPGFVSLMRGLGADLGPLEALPPLPDQPAPADRLL